MVERRIVRPPAGRHRRFEDVRLVVVAPNGAVAGRLADAVKAAQDWNGDAPLDPVTAWA